MTITFGEQMTIPERVAGRELDAEVAEKVMGLDPQGFAEHQWSGWESIDTHPYCMLRYCRQCLEGESKNCDHHIPLIECIPPIPLFSTDIAAAWEVVEKVCLNNGAFTWEDAFARFSLEQWNNNYWVAMWHELDEGFVNHGSAQANTVPLAICLAALKAVE